MANINSKIKAAVEEYQCPGCVCGSGTSCYEQSDNEACKKHVAGTMITGIGLIFLGMPTGFNRLGACDKTKINIFSELKDGWGYDLYNVPVWKYKDRLGNTIVRGICPRTNFPWIHIFLTDCMEEIGCQEITEKELSKMD